MITFHEADSESANTVAVCTYYEIKYVKNDSGFVYVCSLALMTMNFISLSHNPNRWSTSDHCTLFVPRMCVCVPQLRDRGQVTRLSQKFTMSKVDSLFLVGARKDMQRQWILKMGIFTKKPVVPSGRHDTYRIIALHPDGIFLIGQIYWSKCLVWTAVICECEFLSFSRSNVFCVYREASREWSLTHSRSLTLMQ